MQQISIYLVGEDGQSGNLDAILTALRRQDAENTANGNPTKHFETFARTVRDFSPDVSKRIDLFLASYEPEIAVRVFADTAYKQAIFDGAIPAGANIEPDLAGNIIAGIGDGSNVLLENHGNQFRRSVALDGVDAFVSTPLVQADYSKALNAYEAIRQNLAPKLKHCQQVLTFLNNPKFTDIPLTDMQDGIRKILGYTLYSKLGISSMTNKQQLISLMQTNIKDYSSRLAQAEKTRDAAFRKASKMSQERHRENDEKIKTTLRAVKYSGLGLLDVSYLITQVKSGFTKMDIGVPVEIQNFNFANGDF